MRKFTGILASAALMMAASSVHAEGSYLGFGFGLRPNLASLGGTITVDGLDSRVGQPALTGVQRLGGCNTAASQAACRPEQPGNAQEAIIPDNKLIALEKNSAMLITSEPGGAMHGLVLEVFWESEGDGTFWRVGLQYVDRLTGGHQRSYILREIKWYDVRFDYYNWTIPFYYGVKVGIGETGAVYGGLGLNYSWGGWTLEGSNVGEIPLYIAGRAEGLTSVVGSDGTTKGGSALYERAKFRVHGFGYNALIGVETRFESGDAFFFEIETIVAGDQGVAYTQSQGGGNALAQNAAYPINLSGTQFKMGYKMAM